MEGAPPTLSECRTGCELHRRNVRYPSGTAHPRPQERCRQWGHGQWTVDTGQWTVDSQIVLQPH